jgi:CBS domain-containing membrane protein
MVRAAMGVAMGLALTGLTFVVIDAHGDIGFYMVAPFGATAVLVFAAPSSPLAQPWPVVVGNTSAAIVGVAVTPLIPDLITRVSVAVALTVAVMLLLRAVHPPAGAIAMTVAVAPEAGHSLGFTFALVPVAAGTFLLVIVAAVYGRITGQHYPFRQFDAAPTAVDRVGLTESELNNILTRYQQSLNLGVADLARLVGPLRFKRLGTAPNPLTPAPSCPRIW